jgi:hypothetical protein
MNVKKILIEQSRFEILLNKLTKPTVDAEGNKKKPLLTVDQLNALIEADPTTKLNNVDLSTASENDYSKIKAGKYVNWLIKQFLSLRPDVPLSGNSREDSEAIRQARNLFIEDLYKVTDDLKKYERFKSRIPSEFADINKININTLYDITKDFDLIAATTTKSERKKMEVYPGAELAYDGDNWRVIKISDKGELGKEAACFYGGGNHKETRWCTAAPGLNYFNQYINQGPLYVIYNPSDTNIASGTGLPVERYQFHFESDQFMDKEDRQIDLVDFLTGKMSELKDFFKPMFINKVLSKNEKVVDIKSLSDGMIGKFISIYGLDDLFNIIPDTIESISISDNSGRYSIDIPSSIGKFKNLSLLTLNNVVKSIPNDICELENLQFITLSSNPNLKSVPQCISDLKNLYVFSYSGSESLVLSKEFLSKFTDDLGGFLVRH